VSQTEPIQIFHSKLKTDDDVDDLFAWARESIKGQLSGPKFTPCLKRSQTSVSREAFNRTNTKKCSIMGVSPREVVKTKEKD
jgi:hypothetical protein